MSAAASAVLDARSEAQARRTSRPGPGHAACRVLAIHERYRAAAPISTRAARAAPIRLSQCTSTTVDTLPSPCSKTSLTSPRSGANQHVRLCSRRLLDLRPVTPGELVSLYDGATLTVLPGLSYGWKTTLTTVVGANGTWSLSLSLARGYYTLSVTQTDPVSGLFSAAATATVSVGH